MYAPSDLIDQADVALDAAVDIIYFYSEFFGVPYPLPKQGISAWFFMSMRLPQYQFYMQAYP